MRSQMTVRMQLLGYTLEVSLGVNHFEELNGDIFNVRITVLTGPASHSQQRATMDIFEIPERKLVSRFGPFSMALIDPEMPFAIFSESVRANELILVLRRRMMISPRISFISDEMSLRD